MTEYIHETTKPIYIIFTISALNEGFWLVRDEYGLILKQVGRIDSGDVLEIAKHWSVEIELASEEF